MNTFAKISDFLSSMFQMLSGTVKSLVTFLKYIPKLIEVVGYGANTLLDMFNYLPQFLFLICSIVVFIGFWYLIFGR